MATIEELYLKWRETRSTRPASKDHLESFRNGVKFLIDNPTEDEWHEFGLGWHQHVYRRLGNGTDKPIPASFT